tara:strand:- start:395 stop:517 length:123 start_codon:yes stop_codon:yes gene_type:complete
MKKQLNNKKYKRRMDKMLDLLEKQNELFLKLINELKTEEE